MSPTTTAAVIFKVMSLSVNKSVPKITTKGRKIKYDGKEVKKSWCFKEESNHLVVVLRYMYISFWLLYI